MKSLPKKNTKKGFKKFEIRATYRTVVFLSMTPHGMRLTYILVDHAGELFL